MRLINSINEFYILYVFYDYFIAIRYLNTRLDLNFGSKICGNQYFRLTLSGLGGVK